MKCIIEQSMMTVHLPDTLRLERIDNCLSLYHMDHPQAAVCVDFSSPTMRYRRQQAVRQQAVVKAAGKLAAPTESEPQLIDATAGLGVDAFLLASAGWHVRMIEQSPVIHALLVDGLQRAQQEALSSGADAAFIETVARLSLADCEDSRVALTQVEPVDVIYLDPMFPTRKKTAQVKKDRWLLQQLHDESAEGKYLLDIARHRARKVVVKRPVNAEPLDEVKPSSSLTGKTSRFDIYVGQLK